eukprot:118809_1
MAGAQVAYCGFDGAQRWPQCVEQALAFLGERHVTGGPVQQAYPQLFLQGLQALRQRRARDPHLNGRFGEAAVVGDVGKPGQLGQQGRVDRAGGAH